jgi:hypothetical protein
MQTVIWKQHGSIESNQWRGLSPGQLVICCCSLVLVGCRRVAGQLLVVRQQHRVEDALLQVPEGKRGKVRTCLTLPCSLSSILTAVKGGMMQLQVAAVRPAAVLC